MKNKFEIYEETKKPAFTLAEVLITLLIIGVVASLTLPTLIAKVNDKVAENQTAVFKAKFIKGLNLAKTAGDLNNTYSSTYDFLTNGLAKHYKMTKICDSTHIRECVPYDIIKYQGKNEEKSLNVSDIQTPGRLKLSGNFKDIAAFVSGDGIPVILSYDKSCLVDTEELDNEINSCVAGIYDINGSRKPNNFGTKIATKNGKSVTSFVGDLHSFNGASLGNCAGIVGNTCIASTIRSVNNSLVAEIQAIDNTYAGMPRSRWGGGTEYNDLWQLSKDYCKIVARNAHVPSRTELMDIAKAFYGADADINESGSTSFSSDSEAGRKAIQNYTNNKVTLYEAFGIDSTTNSFSLWSSSGSNGGMSYGRTYEKTYTYWHDFNPSYNSIPKVICIGDN